jgi:rhodanese-related sulfurtransferase
MDKIDRRRKPDEDRKTKVIQIRMTEKQSKELANASKELGIERATIIRRGVHKYLLEQGIDAWREKEEKKS